MYFASPGSFYQYWNWNPICFVDLHLCMHKFSTKLLNTRKVHTSSTYHFIFIWALILSKISKSMLCIVWQNKFPNPCYNSNNLNELKHICSLLLHQVCISIEILYASFFNPFLLNALYANMYLQICIVSTLVLQLMFDCEIHWLEIMYILLKNLLHAFCSAIFFCITFGRIYCIVSDMNTWYFQVSPKHVSMKSAFPGEKYIFLLTSYAYDFFNSLQVNEICICPLLILLPLKIKYQTKISTLSFSRIAKSMLSYNFVCIVWPKKKLNL